MNALSLRAWYFAQSVRVAKFVRRPGQQHQHCPQIMRILTTRPQLPSPTSSFKLHPPSTHQPSTPFLFLYLPTLFIFLQSLRPQHIKSLHRTTDPPQQIWQRARSHSLQSQERRGISSTTSFQKACGLLLRPKGAELTAARQKPASHPEDGYHR